MCNPAQVVAERLPQLLVSNGVDFAAALAQLDFDICGALPAHSFIGTTVTVVHIDRTARRLRVAHVGDSRALLIKQRQSSSGNNSSAQSSEEEGKTSSSSSYRCLTTDHLPTRADENARIEQAGGHVFKGRVNGVLAVSRSVGDRALKKVVPATPDVADVPLADDDAVLVVASDGLWDVVAVERVVDIVRQWHSTNSRSSCEGDEDGDEDDEDKDGSESGDDKANGKGVKEDEKDLKKMMARLKLDGGNTSSRRGRGRRRRRRTGRAGAGAGCDWATAAAQALVCEAADEGARDDISVVVVDVRSTTA